MSVCNIQLGINGKFLHFLKALYEGTTCRVKVGGEQSKEFQVNAGLRQGSVLSPLLFSINQSITKV